MSENIGEVQSAVKDLPDELLEELFFAELVKNGLFASKVSKIFKDKWIEDDELRRMAYLVVNWRARFNSEITKDLMVALLSKYAETHPGSGIDVSLCAQKFTEAMSLNLGGLSDSSRLKTINEFIKKNILKGAITEGAKLLSRGQLSGVVESCLNVLEEAERTSLLDSEGSLTYSAQTLSELGKSGSTMNSHYETIANPAAKISTGWPTLDFHTSGGFWKEGKSIYIFMGQAGLGKTVALTNLAYNFLCQGLRVVVFTLEMSEDVYGLRFDALFSDVGLDDMVPLVDTVKARVAKFFEVHPTAELVVKEFPPHQASTNTFVAYLENLQKTKGHDWKPDVIIVDYLNLVASATPGGDDQMYQEGIQVTEQLRAMSYKFECPVVTAVQTNTEGMDTSELGMKNIAQSRGIAHAADFIMAIYNNDGIIRGKIIKSRLGAVPQGQTVSFRRDERTLKMFDLQNDFSQQGTSPASGVPDDLPESLKSMTEVSNL